MARVISLLVGVMALCALATSAPRALPAGQGKVGIRLQPRFTPGQVMRYRVALETTSATRQSGLVRDPQGPGQLTVIWNATVRLDVFAAESDAEAPASSTGSIRLRSSYEQSVATVHSDTPDPRAQEIEEQYAQLAGRSLEFTLASDGRVADVRGLDSLVANERARAAVQQWIAQLSAAASIPPARVAPRQKWTSTRPADLPLAGLSWRTDATYLRNEPCRPAISSGATAGTPSAFQPQDCAVIQSRLALVTTRALRDPTPESYHRNGLRTSGRWTGLGESLMYVALGNGWVVSTTQESREEMDVTISGAAGGSVRYSGTVRTRSQVSLLEDEHASAP